ncbi:hypothetical protein [Phosphitispora sp. TUW77]|uniref:hypothetical protein n=1 Tax=Phosphitispora sp. TUW77 TaxID=3152361 RepID=UPI003AB5DAEB
MNVYGKYYPFAGMNLKGNFVNFQEMYIDSDIEDAETVKPEKEIYAVDLFFSYLQGSINIDQVSLISPDTKILYPENFNVHSLFADIDEKATILECVNGKAVQSKLIGRKIVMTNFSNFLNSENIDLGCIGADRYLTASKMVEEDKDLLNIERAINILRKTFQMKELYQHFVL